MASPSRAYVEASLMCRDIQCISIRSFSATSKDRADEPAKPTPSPFPNTASSSSPSSAMASLADLFQKNKEAREEKSTVNSFIDVSRVSSIGSAGYTAREDKFEEPHHFHVYATKHNTHITLTSPNRNSLISVSTGNIGFKKSGRKHYDSAFQLASYVMGRIQEQGLLPKIRSLEVCLRGFGAGREAVTKALLGSEGHNLRNKVVKVSDATRLKFGGTRSPKPRRLG